MQCVVCTCDCNDLSDKTTYFKFPTDPSLRTAWLKTLHKGDWLPKEDSAICSKHFQTEDLLDTGTGLYKLREGAVPIVNVQVCRICFAIDCKLYPLKAYKALYSAYETLTGLSIQREDKIAPYLCHECAHQLLKFVRFQTKSLEAHSILLEIYTKHNFISLESIRSVHGIQEPHTRNVTPTQSDLYDIDMELAEMGNINTNDQTIATPTSGVLEGITVDCVKVENDDVITQSSINVNGLANDVMVYISIENVYEDTADNLKTEKSNVRNEDNINNELNNNDMSEDTLVEAVTPNAEQVTASVQNVTEAQHDMNHTKGDTHSQPEAEDRTSITGKAVNDSSQLEDQRQNVNQTNTRIQTVIEIPELAIDIQRKPGTEDGALISGDTTNESPPSGEGRINAEESITDAQVTKIPEESNHMELYTDGNVEGTLHNVKFSCHICDFETNVNAQLMSHLKAHAALTSYNCSMCNYKTIYKRSLIWHIRVHSGQKPHACDKCDKAFIKKSHLKMHISKHSGEKPYYCDLCNKGFGRKDVLKVHLKSHSGEKPYTCHICNRAFAGKCSLQKHLRTHSGEKPYLCHLCVKTFNGIDKLKAHLKKHSAEKEHSSDVLVPNSRVHYNQGSISCDVCSKDFMTRSSLQKHFRLHSDEKLYLCHICKQTFLGNNKFEEHVKTHPREKLYSCNVCNCLFMKKGYLKRHMSNHSSTNPYTCRVCNKSFRNDNYLQDHLSTHSGEKPFSCNICKKAFVKKAYLRKHSRKHSDKKYTCDICNKSFIAKDYIQIHLRIHSGERPYSCLICKKAFTRKAHLQKHSNVHLKKRK